MSKEDRLDRVLEELNRFKQLIEDVEALLQPESATVLKKELPDKKKQILKNKKEEVKEEIKDDATEHSNEDVKEENISLETVQNLCVSIVRSTPEKKGNIIEIVEKVTGKRHLVGANSTQLCEIYRKLLPLGVSK